MGLRLGVDRTTPNVAGGCGGGGDDSAKTASTTPTAPLPFEPEEAAIGLSDLPPGWAEDPGDVEANRRFCGQEIGVPTLGRADVAFAEGGNLPFLLERVVAYAPGDAQTTIGEFAEIAADCDEYEQEGQTVTVARSSFPDVGDESVPLLLSTEIEDFNVAFYTVAIRVGRWHCSHRVRRIGSRRRRGNAVRAAGCG